ALRHAAAGNDDLRALIDENLSRAKADAAGRAGDDCDLAVKPSHVVSFARFRSFGCSEIRLASTGRPLVTLEPIIPDCARQAIRASRERLFVHGDIAL